MSREYKVGLLMIILGYVGIVRFDNIIPAIIFAIGFVLIISSYVNKK